MGYRCRPGLSLTWVLSLAVLYWAVLVPSRATSNFTAGDFVAYAINLECLEAQFYSCAVTGRPLPLSLTGHSPRPQGCHQAPLKGYLAMALSSIARDEVHHLQYWRNYFGGTKPTSCPFIDFKYSFSAFFEASTNTSACPLFDPFTDEMYFIASAFILEDVMVTAYQGMIDMLFSQGYVGALYHAAGIMAVEGYHAGAIRQILLSVRKEKTVYNDMTIQQLISAFSSRRDLLDGSGHRDVGIASGSGRAVIAPADRYGMAFHRDPQQVMRILYGGSGTGGMFYPNGMNGIY